MKNHVLHRAKTRGYADHGWLKSFHTFSFASYHHPERMHFGVLRVLNDDTVSAGMGFGKHPHQNMEIISIPLEGDLEHRDSMGNVSIIREGDVQVMSAGTGVEHSEFNKNKDQAVKFLQIWVFPKEKGVEPRYDQQSFPVQDRQNRFQQIVSPNPQDEGVWIHQDAWFHLGEFESGLNISYQLKKEGNGVYIFMLEGRAQVDGEILDQRDGLGIIDGKQIDFKALEQSKVLVMEVPMR